MLGVSIVLFVVLLAVLFAVAAVTAGFGDLMKPVFQDARPVGLPETQVAPDDLDALRFNVVLRGYKMAEVDAVLHRMSRELAERDAVLAELRAGQLPRSFRPAPPPAPPFSPNVEDDRPTEMMAPYVDPYVDPDVDRAVDRDLDRAVDRDLDPDVDPDVDTDEHLAIRGFDPAGYRTLDAPTEVFPAVREPPAATD